LKEFTAVFRQGETTALVGGSGAPYGTLAEYVLT
jgi:hypothetical protein